LVSSSTTQAALPPNSRIIFFLPALAFKAQPTSGEPVKLFGFNAQTAVI